jgi:hypothetical protein
VRAGGLSDFRSSATSSAEGVGVANEAEHGTVVPSTGDEEAISRQGGRWAVRWDRGLLQGPGWAGDGATLGWAGGGAKLRLLPSCRIRPFIVPCSNLFLAVGPHRLSRRGMGHHQTWRMGIFGCN